MTTRFASPLRKSRLLIFLLFFCLVLPAANAHSARVTLTWNPPEAGGVTGYRVYCRAAAEPYDYKNPSWEGIETTCTLFGLDDDTGYCFVVRTVNGHNEESVDSNEVCSQPKYRASVVTDDPGKVGDMDPSGALDLADVIMVLQVLSGGSASPALEKAGDVNGDGKIGLEEAVYVLQVVAATEE